MLNGLIHWSIENRWIVILMTTLGLLFGLLSVSQMPIDVFPDFAPVQVVVQTEAPGYAPEEVESVITLPLESRLNGLPRVRTIRSVSTTGLSVLTIIFEEGTDIFQARQSVGERLQAAQDRLPPGVGRPVMVPISTAAGDILKIGLLSTRKTSPLELRTLADWTIRPRLMAVPGVSNILTYGGEVKQYQVLVNPHRLNDFNLSLNQVIEAARASNTNAVGGLLPMPDTEYLLRGIGRVQDKNDILNSVITVQNGTPITIGNVAQVEIGPAFKIGDAVINGQPGVILNVIKQPWANTLNTTHQIESALTALQGSLPADVSMIPTFRQADFIEAAIHNVLEAMVLGGILVMVILVAFLRNWRTAFISMLAIPLSLLSAVVVLKWLGLSLNVMTLGGLAIAIGEVVDDAIIDVENVYRRLAENAKAQHPLPVLTVVLNASREIRASVVYATFIVALVFLPVLSLGGLEGKIFTPLALAYILAILASLLVAIMVTPALCAVLLGRSSNNPENQRPGLQHWVQQRYAPLLHWALQRPKQLVASALGLFLISLALIPLMGKTFLPEFDESNLIVVTQSSPGTPLAVTAQTGRVLTGHFIDHHDVKAAGQRIGRAEEGEDYEGNNFSEIDIRLRSTNLHRKSLLAHVRSHFSHVPGLLVNIGSYVSHQMDHALSGVNAAIAIKIFGPDLAVLQQKAQTVETILRSVPGAVDVQMEPVVPIPQITIRMDREAAAQYGLTVAELARSIEAAFKGIRVSQVLEGQKLFDLFVWFEPPYRSNLQVIQSTLVDTAMGLKVPIRSVADVQYSTSPNVINRENVSRRMVVQANVSGRDLGSLMAEARARIERQLELPPGYYLVYGGQFEAQQAATRQLLLLSGVAIAGIFVLLWLAFRTTQAALLVMVNLPLALIGGLWAITLSGNLLSVGSLVGFITLFGISTRNGVMLVTHFNHLLANGVPFQQAIVQGAHDRVVPVLMTALTAALGVLPIAVMGGTGRELEQPLAIVILGGMISATTLTLLILPVLFYHFGHHALSGNPLQEEPGP